MSLNEEACAVCDDEAPAAAGAVLSFSTSTIVRFVDASSAGASESFKDRVQFTILKRFCWDFSRFWFKRHFKPASGCFLLTISLASSFVSFEMCSRMLVS